MWAGWGFVREGVLDAQVKLLPDVSSHSYPHLESEWRMA